MQARFLIPMAVSLAFGVVFSTVISLVLVPALYVILEDVKRVAKSAWQLVRRPVEAPAHEAGRTEA